MQLGGTASAGHGSSRIAHCFSSNLYASLSSRHHDEFFLAHVCSFLSISLLSEHFQSGYSRIWSSPWSKRMSTKVLRRKSMAISALSSHEFTTVAMLATSPSVFTVTPTHSLLPHVSSYKSSLAVFLDDHTQTFPPSVRSNQKEQHHLFQAIRFAVSPGHIPQCIDLPCSSLR